MKGRDTWEGNLVFKGIFNVDTEFNSIHSSFNFKKNARSGWVIELIKSYNRILLQSNT
jgi:hypothetical protein